MNTDIRISVSFKGHRKRKKLKMYLECESAVDYLIDFWISVATDRPSGELNGLDNLDLALMAGWNGDPDEFVGAMIKAGFIDDTEVGLFVHDWPEHNGYASAAKERSDAARRAAKARWDKRNGNSKCGSNARAMQGHMPEHCDDFTKA